MRSRQRCDKRSPRTIRLYWVWIGYASGGPVFRPQESSKIYIFICELEFAANGAAVFVDGLCREAKLVGHFLRRVALFDHLADIEFAGRQLREIILERAEILFDNGLKRFVQALDFGWRHVPAGFLEPVQQRPEQVLDPRAKFVAVVDLLLFDVREDLLESDVLFGEGLALAAEFARGLSQLLFRTHPVGYVAGNRQGKKFLVDFDNVRREPADARVAILDAKLRFVIADGSGRLQPVDDIVALRGVFPQIQIE